MNNIFDEVRKALGEARSLERAIDMNVNAVADIIEGRLKGVSTHILSKLKKELKNFNAHTGEWKE